MPNTPREMYTAVRTDLPKRTGLTLNEWLLLLQISGPRSGRKEQVEWLKATYGLGTMQASVIASEAATVAEYAESEKLIENQFSGSRKALLPIADKVLAAAQSLGVDVRVEPCQNYVPLIRKREFAVVKPSESDQVDLGLALPGAKATRRLVPVKKASGSDRITHHVTLRSSDEVDAEVVAWLRKAYELDAKAN